MKGEDIPALKKNIAFLDENIGMFFDDTRDAVKESVLKIRRLGFINGGTGKEDDIIRSLTARCGSAPEKNESGKPIYCAKEPSQVITYVSAHDNQTLWDKLASGPGRRQKRV